MCESEQARTGMHPVVAKGAPTGSGVFVSELLASIAYLIIGVVDALRRIRLALCLADKHPKPGHDNAASRKAPGRSRSSAVHSPGLTRT